MVQNSKSIFKTVIKVILFVIVFTKSFSMYSQNTQKYEVIKIDSVILKYYYVIDVKLVNTNYWITILSKKENLYKSNDSLSYELIKVGNVYRFSLSQIYEIMVDKDEEDSVYLAPVFVGDIIINKRLFLSHDYKIFPYSTENLKGLYYIKKKEKQNNKKYDNPTPQPTNEQHTKCTNPDSNRNVH